MRERAGYAPRLPALVSRGDSCQPERSVVGIPASNDHDAEVGDREQGPTDTHSRHLPRIEIVTLNQEVCAIKVNPETGRLPPQSTVSDASVEIADGLAFHADAFRHELVGHGQALERDRGPET